MLEPNPLDVTAPAKPAPETGNPPAAPETMTAEASPDPQDIGSLYIEFRMLLLSVACRKFRVPECDAENLIQDVFLSYLQAGTRVENIRAWLVAAMCNASRHYYRAQGRTESLPDDMAEWSDPTSASVADKMAMEITTRQALGYLQGRCRETMYLHYFEGRSAADIARMTNTTSRYAEKLIHNCLKRLREIYFSINSMKK